MNSITVEQIAEIAHAANLEYRAINGEAPGSSWAEMDEASRQGVIHGVRVVQEDAHADEKELHRQWSLVKQAQGWEFGKDINASEKTHPNLVEWDQLPLAQRMKDSLFLGIVRALSGMPLGTEVSGG